MAKATATASSDHQSLFRSSSRCSRKLMVGNSAPFFVPASGIGGPGLVPRLPGAGAGRCGVDFPRGLIGPCDFRLERILQVRGSAPELCEPLPDGTTKFGKLARSEDQQCHKENDDQFRSADRSEHTAPRVSAAPTILAPYGVWPARRWPLSHSASGGCQAGGIDGPLTVGPGGCVSLHHHGATL